ncbi:MAG: GNAT family N-acetyltransferase [Flavobacteriales bacterium]|nr:GNAT family N-acetyltransferase [Flavobacteriales bacterium]
MIEPPIPSLNGLLTGRLHFRKLVAADAEWWMDYINSAEAIRFMPLTLGSRADCMAMIQRSLDRYAADGSGLHAVELRSTGEPIGQCGLLTQLVDGAQELEIGYHFLPQHWGKGYAAEAAIAYKQFAAEHGLAPSVISLIDEENHRSQAVAQRNGMLYEKRTVHRGVPALVFRASLPHSAKYGSTGATGD